MTTDRRSDGQLLDALRLGDGDAIAGLYDRYADRVGARLDDQRRVAAVLAAVSRLPAHEQAVCASWCGPVWTTSRTTPARPSSRARAGRQAAAPAGRHRAGGRPPTHSNAGCVGGGARPPRPRCPGGDRTSPSG